MSTTAFVFPGQGSQTIGMLNELVAVSDTVKNTFAEASDALGYDLWQLIAHGPAEALNQTDKTQPALLASSVAIWRHYLAEGGATPAVMAGHSLGEYSALTCAGVLQFADALRLVKARGEFMQDAVPTGTGAMYAIIGLDDDKIVEICAEQANEQVVSAVNFNSPGQVVIAGHADAVARAGDACKAAGAKRALPLPVSVPSHCALMKPAADRLATELDKLTLSSPEFSVINNVDVIAETTPEAIKSALVRQLYSPVRWTETVQKMSSEGITHLLECGPGKVLTGLTKRIDKSLSGSALNTPETVADAL